jgi:hypothetical protein
LTAELSFDAVLACASERWWPRMGDPTVMGWVTVASYVLGAVLCMILARRRSIPGGRLFWGVLALLLVALAVNKQLDLQSAATAIARCVAQLQGWYEARRPFQFRVVVALLAIGAIAAAMLFWRMRRHLLHIWLALLGICFVASFVAVRAIGFTHVDRLINLRIEPVRMNWVLELSGILMITLNALWLMRRRTS